MKIFYAARTKVPQATKFFCLRMAQCMLFCAAFLANNLSFAMWPAAIECEVPQFQLGRQAIAVGQDPALLGYRKVSTFKNRLLKAGQKVVVPRSNGSYTFAQAEAVSSNSAKVFWREQSGENSLKILPKGDLYVHNSWNRCSIDGDTFMPNCAQGMRHYDSVAEWVAHGAQLSGEKSILVGDYFEFFCQEVYADLLEHLKTKTAAWFEDKNIFTGVTALDEDDFEHCYVQKLYIHQPDAVLFFGDFHGDAASLIRALQNLVQEGRLRDDFRLTNPNTHLVFLGDYVDRGPCSVETLYLLLMLKLKNPDNVILLRGNHEDGALCEFYGFGRELSVKFGLEPNERKAIYSLFDVLPLALYLGCQEGAGYTWTVCCHAGLEIGFSAKEFLDSGTQYLWLNTIRRNYHANRLPDSVRSLVQKAEKLPKMDTFVARTKRSQEQKTQGAGSSAAPVAPACFNPKGLQDIGFLWNDFIFDGPGEFAYNDLRGCQFGSQLTRVLLERDGLCRIVRGHQHNGDFLKHLYQARCVPSFDGLVYTLMSGNVFFGHTVFPGQQEFNYSYARFSYEQGNGQDYEKSGWYMHPVCSIIPQEPSQATQPFEDEAVLPEAKKQKKELDKKGKGAVRQNGGDARHGKK